jgi:hypothetical protein
MRISGENWSYNSLKEGNFKLKFRFSDFKVTLVDVSAVM